MRRLAALTLLGVLLACAVGVLYAVGRSGLDAEAERMRAEARANQERTLEAVRQDVDRTLREVVSRESARPYYAYQTLYTPPNLVAQQPAYNVSPLVEAPTDPLVQVYFEYREDRITSPCRFDTQPGADVPELPKPSAYSAKMEPVLDGLEMACKPRLKDRLAQDDLGEPVSQEEVDSLVVRLNKDQGEYLAKLSRDTPAQRAELNTAWRNSQHRQGRKVGQFQYGAPQTKDPQTKKIQKESVPVRLYAFSLVVQGADADGWPERLLAVRRVQVGEEVWLQGFAFDLDHLRREVLPDVLARHGHGKMNISPSLDWARLPWEEEQGAVELPEARIELVATDEEIADLTTLPLLGPLDDQAIVYRGGAPDPEAVLAPSRSLLDAALLLVGSVVFLGSGILLLAALGQRRLAQQRADFVAALTHELRAPLTGLRALAELLHEGLVPDEAKKQEYYASMLSESERLGRLVQNVLDAAKIERGTALQVVAEPLDPGPILAELADRFRTRLETQGMRIELDMGEGVSHMMADREAFTHVVANLIDNAAKYGKGGDDLIRLEAREDGGVLAVTVSDGGPGIPASERERIFERFFRSSSAPREVGGAGLGLAIARALSRAQGGDLTAGEAPGGGALFRLTLPLAPA